MDPPGAPAALFRAGRTPARTTPREAGWPEQAAELTIGPGGGMKPRMREFWAWARVQLFRLWTALAVLAGFGYMWVYRPEYLTWWKRTVNALVDTVCGWLPYPWGDRIGSTIGNFGIWVQLTLAILAFRAAIGLVLMGVRRRR